MCSTKNNLFITTRDTILALTEQAAKYRSLDDWFYTPQGRRVALAIVSELTALEGRLNGELLLQLGSCGENPWLSKLHFIHQWIVNPCSYLPSTSCVALVNGLPFDRNSIDCVIAPLTMEALANDRKPLDEIDRVLKPMGHVIFLGVNPWSFWGAALRFRKLMFFGGAPSSLTSSFSVKRALLHRGYRQWLHSSFYYIPPLISKPWIQKLEFLNEMGKMIWPFPAGFYCLIMQKYQPGSSSLLKTEDEGALLQQNRPSLITPGSWIHENERAEN